MCRARARLAGLRKDGTFPVRVSLSPVPTATGGLIMAAIRDITGEQTRRPGRTGPRRCRGRTSAPGSVLTADSQIPVAGPGRGTDGMSDAVNERPDRSHGDALNDRLVQHPR
jgi:hypothetical protein